jgi:hypothetical protein
MEENKLKNSLQRIPDVVKGWVGLITVIVGVIIAIRNERQLYAVIVPGVILIIWLGIALYIIFARRPGSFSKRGPYRYESYRWTGFLSIGFVLGAILSFSLFTPNRSFVSGAFLGTPTPTITPTIISFTETPTIALAPSPTPTEIPTATPTPVILLQESFINNDNGWELNSYDGTVSVEDEKIIGGKLIKRLACTSSYHYPCSSLIEVPNFTAKNFDLSFDAKVTDITESSDPLAIQVVFRNIGGESYGVLFSNKGKLSVYLIKDNSADYIVKDVFSKSIDQGINNVNHFRIIAQGSTFIVYANEQEVARLEDGNNSSNGKIYLGFDLGDSYFDRDATVEFDNLLIQDVQ